MDDWLILTAYAGIVSTGVFLAEFSIWLSATAPDSRRASARAFLCSIAWFSGPFFVTHLFPCLGVRLPGWLRAANAWLLASSPASLLMKWPSLAAGKGLIDSIAWMCGLHYAALVALDGDRNRRGPLRVAATCLIGIVVPVSGGLFVWRYATAHFDRLVGRPLASRVRLSFNLN